MSIIIKSESELNWKKYIGAEVGFIKRVKGYDCFLYA